MLDEDLSERGLSGSSLSQRLALLRTGPLLPVHNIPSEWFENTRELPTRGWPDFTHAEVADWPSNAQYLDGRASGQQDVALVLAFPRVIPDFVLGDTTWQLLRHETGGHWVGDVRCLATRLQLSDRGAEICSAIAKAWAGSGVDAHYASLDDLSAYRSMLLSHGLDCNLCIQQLAEGCFPIDLDLIACSILTTGAEDADEIIRAMDTEAACLLVLSPN